MKIDQILNEGFLDNMKASFNQGRKDYIAKRAGELGITAPPAPTTSVPTSPTKTAPPTPKAPVKKTLNAFIKEIDGLSKQQQIKIYNYLQDKLF
jgi:hypothetical protein